MLARIDDLRKGDVVLTPIGSHMAEVKILRQPTLAKYGKKTTWYGKPKWTSILCAVRYEEEVNTSPTSGHVWKRTIPVVADGKDYNVEKRIDFTSKTCWIIKRER